MGPKVLIELLRQRSRPYLFSNSLPPPVVGCATKAVELLLASNEIAQSMSAKTMRCVYTGTGYLIWLITVCYIFSFTLKMVAESLSWNCLC